MRNHKTLASIRTSYPSATNDRVGPQCVHSAKSICDRMHMPQGTYGLRIVTHIFLSWLRSHRSLLVTVLGRRAHIVVSSRSTPRYFWSPKTSQIDSRILRTLREPSTPFPVFLPILRIPSALSSRSLQYRYYVLFIVSSMAAHVRFWYRIPWMLP